MRTLKQVAVLGIALLAAACGPEPTAARTPTHPKATISAVSITGPTTVWEQDCNTWSISVTGGTAPYTYQWEGFDYSNLDSTGQSAQGGFSGFGHYILNVWVTDANNDTGFAQLGVYAKPKGTHFTEPCF